MPGGRTIRVVANLVTVLFAWAAAARATAADYAEAAAFTRNGAWEITVTHDAAVKHLSLSIPGNYVLPPGGQLDEIRESAFTNSVVVVLSGVATNAPFDLVLTNVQSTSGAILPSLTLKIAPTDFSWAAIGRQELGLPADAARVGGDGFDLISGASEMYGTYDEATFVYEPVTGDFDKRVRVISQEPSSIEARAGLMVREALDENKPRPLDPSDPAQAFARYLQVQVNPVMTAYNDFDGAPVPANNQYQINFRPLPGGATENPPADTNTPAYPDAWMRLKRVGQTFYVFRGSDGTNWVRLGTFTFPTADLDGNPVPPFPATAYVGPNYSPEVANIPDSSGARRSFLAQFRDYSDASGEVGGEPPQLTISQSAGGGIEISWSAGVLQTTTNIATGSWTDVPGQPPLKISPEKGAHFYRARN